MHSILESITYALLILFRYPTPPDHHLFQPRVVTGGVIRHLFVAKHDAKFDSEVKCLSPSLRSLEASQELDDTRRTQSGQCPPKSYAGRPKSSAQIFRPNPSVMLSAGQSSCLLNSTTIFSHIFVNLSFLALSPELPSSLPSSINSLASRPPLLCTRNTSS